MTQCNGSPHRQEPPVSGATNNTPYNTAIGWARIVRDDGTEYEIPIYMSLGKMVVRSRDIKNAMALAVPPRCLYVHPHNRAVLPQEDARAKELMPTRFVIDIEGSHIDSLYLSPRPPTETYSF